MVEYKDFETAYYETLTNLFYSPQFTNTPRGNDNREILNKSFCLSNPRARYIITPARKTNLIFNFAEALWYLSGSNDLDFISYYCNSMKRFSKDGKTLTGCAYGPKIFTYGPKKINQWDRIVELFNKDDPSSNRAFIQIFDPIEPLNKGNVDLTCTIGLQFFLRNNMLHLSSFMRSNDCYRGMVSDVFSFTIIQELMAAKLGVELGNYYHNVGSMHIYESDVTKVVQYLQDRKTTTHLDYEQLPVMPKGDNSSFIQTLLSFEEKLRKNELKLTSAIIKKANLPSFWEQVLILFGIYNHIHHDDLLEQQLLSKLEPIYKECVINKWEHLTSEALVK